MTIILIAIGALILVGIYFAVRTKKGSGSASNSGAATNTSDGSVGENQNPQI